MWKLVYVITMILLCLRHAASLGRAFTVRSLKMQTPYSLLKHAILAEGAVCKGYGRGSKKLGFPTANLPQFDADLAANAIDRGIYFGWCRIGQEHDILPCVTNIGISPTFVGQENAVNIIESYVLHRPAEKGDFYGQAFRLALVGYIRPEMKFSGLPALIAQIQSDVDVTEQACRALQQASSVDGNRTPFVGRSKDLYETIVRPFLRAGMADMSKALQLQGVTLSGSPAHPSNQAYIHDKQTHNSARISPWSEEGKSGGYKLFGTVDVANLREAVRAPIGQGKAKQPEHAVT